MSDYTMNDLEKMNLGHVPATDGVSLLERFERRLLDHAKRGIFGNLRTLKATYQSGLAHFVSLLDNAHVPVLIHGERGSGKRRLVDEYFTMHNFHLRLQGKDVGRLKVFRADYLSAGFTAQLQTPHTIDTDLVYIEAVDRLNHECQSELLQHLKVRRIWSEGGLALPRLVISCERALSILVLNRDFSRDLFQALTGFVIFVPGLRDRPEDVPHIVQTLITELSGRVQSPPGWLVDAVTLRAWPDNIDELKKTLSNLLAMDNEVAHWNAQDCIRRMNAASATFTPFTPTEKLQQEKLDLIRALRTHDNDAAQVAREKGLSRGEVLKKMFEMGVR